MAPVRQRVHPQAPRSFCRDVLTQTAFGEQRGAGQQGREQSLMSACCTGAPGSACPSCSTRAGWAACRHPRSRDGKANAPLRSKFWWLITCTA